MKTQLSIHTEFSFRSGGRGGGVAAFGPIPRIVERLREMGTTAAGIVDPSTWGHTRFAAEAERAGVRPLFGLEFPVPQPDGKRPKAWVLARDVRALNRFSTAMRAEGADPEGLLREDGGRGLIRVAGAALSDPSTFDYVSVSPASPRAGKRAVRLSRETGRPLLLVSAASYPAPEDRRAFLAVGGREAPFPQHLLSVDEMRGAVGGWMSRDEFANAIDLAEDVVAAADRKLPRAPLISVPGDLRAEAEAGKAYRIAAGHIEWNGEYEARMLRELEMIESKKYESYFLVVSDLVRWAKTRMLVGPGRGSSAGSLVCYLLRITEVDPIHHHLLFERFIDVTRHDLPDIDIDFSDTKREQVFEYLADKYGADKVARLGSVVTLKPRSAINEVGKRLGIPSRDTFDLANVLIEYSSGDSRYGKGLEDTLSGTAPGREFLAKHPSAEVMTLVEGHAWHTGVHAAGVVVCNEPISDFATVADGVAHLDKTAAEALGLLKIDALGLRTLGVIEDSGAVSAETLYGLKLDDPEVFDVFNAGKFSGIFQFEGATQRGVAASIVVRSFRELDHITALARPGPLGGGASHHYIARAAGREAVTFRHPSMAPYLEGTLGVILYQEQVMRISFEIGKFSWALVSELRKAMSGRKGKEYFDRRGAEFIQGAATIGVGPEDARAIWDEINNFGAWGMNASHTVSYSIISYWCAWMKRYHPLEYAAACLRGAKDDEHAMEVLREMAAEGIEYTPFDIDASRETWSVQDGRLVGGFQNVRGIGPINAFKYVALRDAGELDEKTRAKIAAMPVEFSELRPAHARWGELYDDPAAANVSGHISEFASIPDQADDRRGSAVVIAQVKKRTRRDRNEAILIKRRDGARFEGQSLFLDLYVVDDSVATPVIARVGEKLWDEVGSKLADRLVDDEDWLLMRGRWLKDFNMLLVKKVRCLTRPEILE